MTTSSDIISAFLRGHVSRPYNRKHKLKRVSSHNDEHHSAPLWSFCDFGDVKQASRLTYLRSIQSNKSTL